MNPITVESYDISFAWFQCLQKVLDQGRKYMVSNGAQGRERLELDYVTIHIKRPSMRPLAPDMGCCTKYPPPVTDGYLEKQYLSYLMADVPQPNEEYTYGQYLEWQIPEVIAKYKRDGYDTNQCHMVVGDKYSIGLKEPPCLRGIDTRILDSALHFFVYFRSWDLWGGMPANLGGLQLLKEYMASELGVSDGEIIASSKGLHLYDYAWPMAKARLRRE
jgi:thymidylate synthase